MAILRYTTTAIVHIGAGIVLALDASQVSARSHALATVEGKKGLYRTTKPVQFKVGEKLGFESKPDKVTLAGLEAEKAAKAAGEDGVQ